MRYAPQLLAHCTIAKASLCKFNRMVKSLSMSNGCVIAVLLRKNLIGFALRQDSHRRTPLQSQERASKIRRPWRWKRKDEIIFLDADINSLQFSRHLRIEDHIG